MTWWKSRKFSQRKWNISWFRLLEEGCYGDIKCIGKLVTDYAKVDGGVLWLHREEGGTTFHQLHSACPAVAIRWELSLYSSLRSIKVACVFVAGASVLWLRQKRQVAGMVSISARCPDRQGLLLSCLLQRYVSSKPSPNNSPHWHNAANHCFSISFVSQRNRATANSPFHCHNLEQHWENKATAAAAAAQLLMSFKIPLLGQKKSQARYVAIHAYGSRDVYIVVCSWMYAKG